MLSNINIVLVGTTHPGNIGAAARAMKNMNLTSLRLVAPKIFPSADATSRASGADDLLARAMVCETLREAIADCQLVFGASARARTISWPELTPRECASAIFENHRDEKIAIVFGREHSGLTNQELDLCRYLLHIPCNPEFSSLNLAAAVQVVCYELFVSSGGSERKASGDRGECPLATAEQMESFYEHLHQALIDIDFTQSGRSKSIMRRLRRIYSRIELDTKEVDILRGILTMSQGHKTSQKHSEKSTK
ncbi:MAG: RNA methyltransferase [Gammaproteobacteria bacterium]